MDTKAPFKPYNQGQITFLPPSLEELIPENHIVRAVDSIIENIDTAPLYERYEGIGASSYNPVMMLKIIIYAYTQKVFSCRSIAKNCRENVMFMWLSGMNTPDYKTIDRFRNERMKDIIQDIFPEVITLLHIKGYIRPESYFPGEEGAEGGKWNDEKLREKCAGLLEAIDEVERRDTREYGEEDLPEINAGKNIDIQSIKETGNKINKKISRKPEESKGIWKEIKKLWAGFSEIK
ncbi:MAG TPA: transposase [Bacillota bacterium]|nr:transposase [Bacillota bacterium]